MALFTQRKQIYNLYFPVKTFCLQNTFTLWDAIQLLYGVSQDFNVAHTVRFKISFSLNEGLNIKSDKVFLT